MAAVGIRELKNQLSRYLKRVQEGEGLTVTDRGRPIALISPPATAQPDRYTKELIVKGMVHWGGGKPKGSRRPPRIKGQSVALAVIEDRR